MVCARRSVGNVQSGHSSSSSASWYLHALLSSFRRLNPPLSPASPSPQLLLASSSDRCSTPPPPPPAVASVGGGALTSLFDELSLSFPLAAAAAGSSLPLALSFRIRSRFCFRSHSLAEVRVGAILFFGGGRRLTVVVEYHDVGCGCGCDELVGKRGMTCSSTSLYHLTTTAL